MRETFRVGDVVAPKHEYYVKSQTSVSKGDIGIVSEALPGNQYKVNWLTCPQDPSSTSWYFTNLAPQSPLKALGAC